MRVVNKKQRLLKNGRIVSDRLSRDKRRRETDTDTCKLMTNKWMKEGEYLTQ